MKKESKIYVAGHRGMVGAAVVRELSRRGYNNLLLKTHKDLDLTDQRAVAAFFETEKPEFMFFCAARVGGIEANRNNPDEFLYENMMMALNCLKSAAENGCKRFEFMGSSCIYPKFAKQPIKEEALLSSALEPTNEGYALAKICGLKYGEYLSNKGLISCISLMPCNLYGIGDTYDDVNSHVIPALIQRFHKAKENKAAEVVCWGDGSPLREFLYADDLAEAAVDLMLSDEEGLINVGSGKEVSIKELSETVANAVGYEGDIVWDESMPNGTPRKLMDSSKLMSMGWKPRTELKEGLKAAYKDFLERL